MFWLRGRQKKKAPPTIKGRANNLMYKGLLWCMILFLLLATVACSGPPQSVSNNNAGSEQSSGVSQSPSSAVANGSNNPASLEPPGGGSSVPAQGIQGPGQSTDEPVASNPPENSYFEIHFIDVGQADAALVICDDDAMLIDGGNVADSSLIYAYLKEHEVSHLKYIVCTHAHEDHVGGLAGALNYATVDVAYCPVAQHDTEAFYNFVKYLDKQNVSITIPTVGDTFTLGSADVTVIGPIKQSSDTNNTSIVLRIVYGTTSFLFTGDAEREEEQDILDSGCTLSSTVLKVGHHGSSNSTTYSFLREIMPEYAVISVGSDNSYGHPTEEALSRLRDAEVTVFRTDMQGHIVCRSDGVNVKFSVQKNADADTIGLPPNSANKDGNISGGDNKNSEENDAGVPPLSSGNVTTSTGTDYVLNTNTHKFHYSSCSSVNSMKESNKSFYNGTRDEVIAMGYSPCGRCLP